MATHHELWLVYHDQTIQHRVTPYAVVDVDRRTMAHQNIDWTNDGVSLGLTFIGNP